MGGGGGGGGLQGIGAGRDHKLRSLGLILRYIYIFCNTTMCSFSGVI